MSTNQQSIGVLPQTLTWMLAAIFAVQVVVLYLNWTARYEQRRIPADHTPECCCLDCHGPYNVRIRPRPSPTGQNTGSLP